MHDTGFLGLVHWDDPGGWYREGGGGARILGHRLKGQWVMEGDGSTGDIYVTY